MTEVEKVYSVYMRGAFLFLSGGLINVALAQTPLLTIVLGGIGFCILIFSGIIFPYPVAMMVKEERRELTQKYKAPAHSWLFILAGMAVTILFCIWQGVPIFDIIPYSLAAMCFGWAIYTFVYCIRLKSKFA